METPETLQTDIEPEALPDISAPTDIKAVFLGGLFFLALLAICYLASEIILPILIAFVLMLVLQPAMRLFENLYLPRCICSPC
jgi:predicted PurR-regulated permease PerM